MPSLTRDRSSISGATDKGVTDVAERIGSEARTILDSFVNRDGIYTMGVHYWHGGLAMSRLIVWIDQLLASELATPEQKAAAKAAAALFGYILWDNDYVPMFDGHGLNLGTANMPVQQANYQQMYALYLASHPFMADRVGGVAEAATGMLQRTVNEHGAHMGSSHYLGASMGPLLNTMVQLKRLPHRPTRATTTCGFASLWATPIPAIFSFFRV